MFCLFVTSSIIGFSAIRFNNLSPAANVNVRLDGKAAIAITGPKDPNIATIPIIILPAIIVPFFASTIPTIVVIIKNIVTNNSVEPVILAVALFIIFKLDNSPSDCSSTFFFLSSTAL